MPAMHLRSLTLQHFRNIPLAALAFRGRQQFLLGANGEGKTNLLEAAGFITALRSFRTTDAKLLPTHGEAEAAIACEVQHERFGDTKLVITLRPDGRELWCDGEKVTKIADYLGRFPTVVFTSQDLWLTRGAPAVRRRWLDLTLAAMDVHYLRALQTYHRALAERNSLLKVGAAADELAAFEHALAPAGAALITRRAAGLAEMGALLAEFYARLADEAEPAGMVYKPNFAQPDANALRARWEAGRGRDLQFRTTLSGPHRDDIDFIVRGAGAKDFASEGQQRSLVLALRLAQAEWCRQKSGVRPVLLADDVLGELDPARRRRFWAAIDPELQVIATGTAPPEAAFGNWQIFAVVAGRFEETTAMAEAPV
jgi:DNA replication and repair protein RecF